MRIFAIGVVGAVPISCAPAGFHYEPGQFTLTPNKEAKLVWRRPVTDVRIPQAECSRLTFEQNKRISAAENSPQNTRAANPINACEPAAKRPYEELLLPLERAAAQMAQLRFPDESIGKLAA